MTTSEKRLYTNSKIFFDNPYVLMADYNTNDLTGTPTDYKETLKYIRRVVKGTWGYTVCNLHGADYFSSAKPCKEYLFRAYFCFKSEEDMLVTTLFSKGNLQTVNMWPSNIRFTITEFV